jgi:hypothetical protein
LSHISVLDALPSILPPLKENAMPVTLSDEDFDYIYETFERMMSPWSTNEELIALMKEENRIWEKLQEIKVTTGAVE